MNWGGWGGVGGGEMTGEWESTGGYTQSGASLWKIQKEKGGLGSTWTGKVKVHQGTENKPETANSERET